MKRNEKLLAGALGLLVVGYFGWPVVDSIFFAPIRRGEEAVALLESQVRNKEHQQYLVQVAAKRLTDWRRQGLPGDHLDAHRLYQQWLTDLAMATGLEAAVTPDRAVPAGDVYHAIQVTLEGKGTFSELQSFLRRFQEANILQRVIRFDIDDPRVADGDPPLTFSLTVEAMNLAGAQERNRLFPQVELSTSLSGDASTLMLSEFDLKVLSPESGDRLRIGTEFVTVTRIASDQLTVNRAVDGTTATEHPAGTVVELFPVRKPATGDQSTLAARIESPFVKPRRYEPRLGGFADQKIARGGTAKMSVKVVDYDAAAGAPTLELANGPAGMTFDTATGELVWTPEADVPKGEYKITLAANVPSPQTRIEQTVTITVADPNTPPELETVAATEVFLGETLRLPLKAVDMEDASALAYKVEQGPEGASVDTANGEFRWSVPESFPAGDVTITVSAADRGEPPMTAKQTFTVKVKENLRPHVFLSGVVIDDVQHRGFLQDRWSNRWIVLKEGTPFEVAGISGIVREIGADFVIYEGSQAVWKIRVGRHLGQAEKIEGASVPESVAAEVKPVEAQKPVPIRNSVPSAAADHRPAS